MKLTPVKIDSIKPAGNRQEYADDYLPGLYLLVQTSGVKSWAARYRHHGRTRKYTLGRYPAVTLQAARNLARTALQAVAEGRDPSIERRKERQSAALQNGLTVE